MPYINAANAEFYAELDATEAFETKAYDYLAPIDYIAGPSKTGYEFAGWYVSLKYPSAPSQVNSLSL